MSDLFDELNSEYTPQHADQSLFGNRVTREVLGLLKVSSIDVSTDLRHVKNLLQLNHIPQNTLYFGAYKEDRKMTVGALLKSFERSKIETEYRNFLKEHKESSFGGVMPVFVVSIRSSRSLLALVTEVDFDSHVERIRMGLPYYSVIPEYGCVLTPAKELIAAIYD